ncbi:aldehyde dehydrogenase family protein [Pseudohaliea sp.]|uniref:aldehyde dehydrogenase family protein n=1 Tax=Pseudohaliea sp. TaxID=2740289 RepID=UPI0032ED768E
MKNNTIEELDNLFRLQKDAFARDRNPGLDARLSRLRALEAMMVDLRQKLRDSISDDFGTHNPWITDIFETGGVLGRNRHIQAKLADWLAPSERPLVPEAHGSSRCEVVKLPKGVMGNIAPWNFPIECSLVMVNEMLAAGNRVIVKLSEFAPATAAVLQESVGDYFDQSVLAVVAGDLPLSQHFASLPWDHLTYTGNTSVGRLVMQAAAANLTPVTLELGGKNPTVFLEDGVNEQRILEYLSFKFCKNGQICTSPDYALVPEAMLEEWVETAERVWRRAYPSYLGHPDSTGIINERHFDRLLSMLEEASDAGARVIAMSDDGPDRTTRQMPMYLVVQPDEALRVMREETFGPITPVITYRSLDEAYDYINSRDRPLASYLVTDERVPEELERFKTAVLSGGAGINVFGFQAAEPGAPFGGVGASGMGCHAGIEGFNGYVHHKTVFDCADDNPVKASIIVPYDGVTEAVANAVFGG